MAGDLMVCPVCNQKNVGKIGENRFFCWNCSVEFNNAAEVYMISEEGNLMKIPVSGR